MKFTFRVDSSLQIGSGHLMRCLTLADELEQKGCQIIFICRELTGNLISFIHHSVLTLSENNNFQSNNLYLNWLGATQDQDATQTINVIPKDTDVLIVDSYAIDDKWHKKLRPFVKKIMVIDDLANKKFDCDILLNQNLGSQKHDYQDKVPDNCQLLLGCDYALLRPEFARLRGQALAKREKTKTVKNILVSMGGSDTVNNTYDILQNISNEFNIMVVLGLSSSHNEIIQNYAKGKNIEVVINATNMAELMLNADLAIGAGGSTSWERCCLGLPTLLYVVAENQREIARNLEKINAVKIANSLKDDLAEIANNIDSWKNMFNKAQGICNGLGAREVSNNLCKI